MKGTDDVAQPGAIRSRRKSRRGSENRRLSATFTMRMTEHARAKLDEVARDQGFKDAKALVMHRLRDDLEFVS